MQSRLAVVEGLARGGLEGGEQEQHVQARQHKGAVVEVVPGHARRDDGLAHDAAGERAGVELAEDSARWNAQCSEPSVGLWTP